MFVPPGDHRLGAPRPPNLFILRSISFPLAPASRHLLCTCTPLHRSPSRSRVHRTSPFPPFVGPPARAAGSICTEETTQYFIPRGSVLSLFSSVPVLKKNKSFRNGVDERRAAKEPAAFVQQRVFGHHAGFGRHHRNRREFRFSRFNV